MAPPIHTPSCYAFTIIYTYIPPPPGASDPRTRSSLLLLPFPAPLFACCSKLPLPACQLVPLRAVFPNVLFFKEKFVSNPQTLYTAIVIICIFPRSTSGFLYLSDHHHHHILSSYNFFLFSFIHSSHHIHTSLHTFLSVLHSIFNIQL